MKAIRIDEEVWEKIKGAAVPFEDQPNDALRRLLGLGKTQSPSPSAADNGGGGNSVPPSGSKPRFDRTKIEETIKEIIKERGGQTRVKDPFTGFNIYNEVADRLGIGGELRKRLTRRGENAWRAEVGFARKNLEQRGEIAPSVESGRGVWKLKK